MSVDYAKLRLAASAAVAALQGEKSRTDAAVAAALAGAEASRAEADAADQATVDAIAESLSTVAPAAE